MPEESTRPLAVVTGASLRIGKAIALELAARGYAIGLHYHTSQSAAQQTAAEIEALGSRAILLEADLGDPAQIERIFAQVAAIPGKLGVLVNSASSMPAGDLRETTLEEWDRVLDLNLRAPWLCAKAAAHLMEDSGGVIINITDSSLQKAWAKYPLYQISKTGLEALTRSLARTLAPAIRVNAVAPGLIQPADGFPEEEWQRLAGRTPLGRTGSPQAVAQAVAFLIENGYITGETLAVDGGYRLT